MIITDRELQDRIKRFLQEYNNYYSDIKYIESETFYIEFIDFLVERGLKIK
jgi:hypothetical protein